MWITKISIRQPVFATMVMLTLVVLGIVAYSRLPVEQMPDVANPQVSINVEYPGASPEAIENDVIKPMEQVVNTVNGVKRIYSTIREGVGFINIEFRLDVDPNIVTQDIRDQVALIRPTFPKEVKDPQISRAASGDQNQQPIVNLAVYSDTRSLRELSTMTDQIIVKRLQNAPGVGNVTTEGSVVRQIRIQLKPQEMRSYGIGVDQVIQAIKDANQDLPAGAIVSGGTEKLVRVEGRIKTPEGFGRIVVANRGGAVYLNAGGTPVYLDQVADVIDGQAEMLSMARLNGRPAVGVDIFKIQKANIVEAGEGVKKAVEALKKELPPDVHVETVWSNADDIKASLEQVKRTIIEGALLTVLIVFLFLHSWRSTIITGLTLPLSVIATFIAIHAFGYTLNFMTLMALSLCIGLLIDDAIVVRENIVRHLSMGKSHHQAAEDGTNEIGLAVMATTFAILAVFVPIAFMNGIIGRYFTQFGLTVAVAVLVSLFVSFTLDPMLSAVWADPQRNRFKYVPWLGVLMQKIEHRIEQVHRIYGSLLEWALGHRKSVLAIAFASFIGSFFLVPFIGTEFVPSTDQGIMSLRLNTPIGSSLQYTDDKTKQVEAALKEFPEIALMSTNVGTEDGRNYSRILIKLTDRKITHRRPQKDVEKSIRERISRIAGIKLSIGWDTPIFISILGPDPAELTRISQDLMSKMAKVPGIADLESSERGAVPTLAIRVRNEVAADLGLSNGTIGNALQPLIGGTQISHWLGPDGQDYDVTVQLPKSDRRISDNLGSLYLSSNRLTADGFPLLVPLNQVADLVETYTPQQLKRLNLQRRVSLYANAEGRPAGDVGSDVQKIMDKYQLPPGYRFDVAGQQSDMIESFQAAMEALGLAVIFIYFILASQFGSFLQPVAIMVSLPLSLVGVLLALLVTGTTLNIFSMIGFIMLMGLVTKNAILLVDFTNQSLREGKSLHDAILTAGQVRLRPILMTTMAMVFGMLPMAIGLGDGGETEAPMGRAVIGGVLTSTMLTLVVVPVIYTYLYRLSNWIKARAARRAADEEAEYRGGGGAIAK